MKKSVIIIIALIFILQFSNAIPILLRNINEYNESKHIALMNDVSDELFTAVASFGFERGRVNVVLNDAGHPDGMEDNRIFIAEKRSEGEKALLNALSKLESLTMSEVIDTKNKVYEIRREVNVLRDLASQNLTLPLDKRDSELTGKWFFKMTEYIESIESLLAIVSQDISDADGIISRYSSLKHKTLSLRNTAGPEISILSATMLSGKPLKEEFPERIRELEVISNENFKELELLSLPLKGSPVYRSLQNLKKSYSEDYVIYRDIIFPLALAGGPYPLSQKEFLGKGVDFLNEIALFMDVLVQQNQDYTAQRLEEGKSNIIKRVFFIIGGFLFFGLLFIIVNIKIINPIVRVTEKILLLAKRDSNVEIPYLNAGNEIGDMARAVDVFKKTLDEIQTLRKIIPICSYCKSIRNDQGLYEEIETYLAKHSEADLSHTICPDCVNKHHPEIQGSGFNP